MAADCRHARTDDWVYRKDIVAMVIKNQQYDRAHLAATIANGASLSGVVQPAHQPRGIAVQVPAVWTAADIGFQVSNDDATYYKLYDKSGNRVKITGIATSAAGVYLAPAEAWALGVWKYLKLESIDTADGTAENQGAERSLSVVILA